MKFTEEQKQRMCYSKAAYPTMKDARTRINKRWGIKRDQMRIYFCPICKQHHITKQPGNEVEYGKRKRPPRKRSFTSPDKSPSELDIEKSMN